MRIPVSYVVLIIPFHRTYITLIGMKFISAIQMVAHIDILFRGDVNGSAYCEPILYGLHDALLG